MTRKSRLVNVEYNFKNNDFSTNDGSQFPNSNYKVIASDVKEKIAFEFLGEIQSARGIW